MVKEIAVAQSQVLVTISGSIRVEEAAQLRESLISYIEEEPKTFIIDLEKVEYIDSAGLGTLLHIRKRAHQKGGSVIIKGLKGFVLGTLSTSTVLDWEHFFFTCENGPIQKGQYHQGTERLG